MSRKLRKEIEQENQAKAEEAAEITMMQRAKERIFSPLVWNRRTDGIRIEDMKESYYAEALDIIREHYIPNNLLCRNVNMKDDEASIKSFLKRCNCHLHDSTSLIAIDEANNEVTGVMIGCVVRKAEFSRIFSRVQIYEGEPQKKIVKLYNALAMKVDIYERFNCDIFYRLYLTAIKNNYRKKGIGFSLMQSGIEVARSLKIPVVVGIFPDNKLQCYARKLGLETLYEISYIDWRDESGEMVFHDPGCGNYAACVMGGLLPPPPPPPAAPKREDEEEVENKKVAIMTRQEKRNAAAEKAKEVAKEAAKGKDSSKTKK